MKVGSFMAFRKGGKKKAGLVLYLQSNVVNHLKKRELNTAMRFTLRVTKKIQKESVVKAALCQMERPIKVKWI